MFERVLQGKIVSFLFALFIIFFTTLSSPVYADPHAVFYTDRAQEQLFYNVLAALNQADYVETAQGQFSRQELEQRRLAAVPSPLPGQSPSPFATETNPTIAATRTLLPGVITRNITLEGDDLWTAYLFQQFAIETDVRRSLSKLARIICTDALGQTGCNNQPGPSQNQSTAFPTDINSYAEQENLSLVSVLSSGTESEKQLQDKLTGTGIGSAELELGPAGAAHPEPPLPENLKFPRPYSAEIAGLRENAKDNSTALGIVNQTTEGVIASQYNTGLDPHLFSKFTISDKGEVTLPEDATFDDYLDVIRGITSLVPASIEIAERGREQGAKFKEYREQTPALAKYTLTKEDGGGVVATINTPSTAIEAQINAGAQQLANQTINQNISGTQEITVPGTKPLLPTNLGSVAGISTDPNLTPPERSGQVAGITDFALKIADLYNKYYNQSQSNPNTPTTGIIPYYEEKGPAELLEALGGTNPNPNPAATPCGFCVSLDQILNSGAVTGTINEVYSDMYCFFFPRTKLCVDRKT